MLYYYFNNFIKIEYLKKIFFYYNIISTNFIYKNYLKIYVRK